MDKQRVLFALLLVAAIPLSAQDLLVSSRFASKVFRYDAQTGASKGVFASGNGMANPNGIAIGPDRNLYVGLGDKGVVLRYDGQTGAFISRFVFDDPATTADETGGLTACRAIKFGPDGNLYVAAGPNDRILRYDGTTGAFLGIAAQLPIGTGPVGLAIGSDGSLYIGGGLSGALLIFRDGQLVRECNAGIAATGVALGSDGLVYVATGAGRTVIRLHPDTCASAGTVASSLALPIYMTFDPAGNLLVGVFNDNTVHRYDPAGKDLGAFVTSGSGGLSGTHDITFVPSALPEELTTVRFIVPGVGRVPGASGSFFRSTLWMTNPADQPAKVRLRYQPGVGFNREGAVDTNVITIPPHAIVTYSDLMVDAFHVTGDTAGAAVVETTEDSPPPLVTARTFNDTAKGTFGQFIQALPVPILESGEAWIHGLAADSANRTNIGVMNPGASEISVTLSLRNPVGAPIGNDIPVAVPANSSIQIGNIQGVAGLGSVPEFSVRATSAGPAFALYASKLDNVTSDPIFITPLPDRTKQWIDGIGAITGVGGTKFRSALSVANRLDVAAHVEIAFVARGEAAPSRHADITLAPHESRFYGSVMADLFNVDGVAGTLIITSDSVITAWARTYSDLGAAGTFGQYIPSFGTSELIGASGAILQGISENAAFRTNAGLFNGGSVHADVNVSAIGAAGSVLAQKTYGIEAGQALSIGRVVLDMGIAPQADIDLRIQSSVAGAVYAWASVVDNTSTDQTFVTPLP